MFCVDILFVCVQCRCRLKLCFFLCALVQRATAICKLSQYQMCVEQLGSFCPYVDAQYQAITLNQDLLQHLVGVYTLTD